MTDEFDGLAPLTWFERNSASYVHDPISLEKFSPEDSRRHSAPGIYFLWDINSSLLYVGQSAQVGGRIWQHIDGASMPIYAFSYFEVAGHRRRHLFLNDVESAYIHALQPAFNLQYRPPRWDVHAALVDAIRVAWRDVIATKHPPVVKRVRIDA